MKAATGAAPGAGGAQAGGAQAGGVQTGGLQQRGGNALGGGLAQQGNMANGSRQAMADAYGAPLVPGEPFRILDWKVIR